MAQLLKDLYNGELNPSDSSLEEYDSDYKQNQSREEQVRQSLFKVLDEKHHKIVEELCMAHNDTTGSLETIAFEKGFSLAMKMVMISLSI